MISYKPLWHTLLDKGVRKTELLKQIGISFSTLSKLNKDQYVALEVIERICLALDCNIEDVVRVEKNPAGQDGADA